VYEKEKKGVVFPGLLAMIGWNQGKERKKGEDSPITRVEWEGDKRNGFRSAVEKGRSHKNREEMIKREILISSRQKERKEKKEKGSPDH